MKDDTISRKEAIDELEERIKANRSNVAVVSELNKSIGYIMRLPSAQPQYEKLTPEEVASEIASGSIMSALPPCERGDRMDDTISRRQAIDAIGHAILFNEFLRAEEAIKNLPVAQPEVQLSPIEKVLHGLNPEEQADFLINLMRGTLAYTDSRVALIRWLERGDWNEQTD